MDAAEEFIGSTDSFVGAAEGFTGAAEGFTGAAEDFVGGTDGFVEEAEETASLPLGFLERRSPEAEFLLLEFIG